MSISDDEVEAARGAHAAALRQWQLYPEAPLSVLPDPIRAALSAAAKVRAIREGDGEWVRVPREPTPEMLRAGYAVNAIKDWGTGNFHHIGAGDAYRAMIAASPIPATGGEKE